MGLRCAKQSSFSVFAQQVHGPLEVAHEFVAGVLETGGPVHMVEPLHGLADAGDGGVLGYALAGDVEIVVVAGLRLHLLNEGLQECVALAVDHVDSLLRALVVVTEGGEQVQLEEVPAQLGQRVEMLEDVHGGHPMIVAQDADVGIFT